ncbi:hypothetical protein SARC_06219 [Sphaeroforma arctica JP610]|uniref:Uncharacterized protein n=1 Tax=Sphaeroforma arctica JP610 TaxID=667725 RepID=A0A0L0FX82_9EUKA|nr:hypothetical protein SARC_06219 [Sphaeroforma arctica JP610]KNC81450.1 hypothetical protein SARC_06219 [Sphaeroforma arctica JP610]|eukprot:XP_014155352.1 hypothetical protein SARC_06219 [Sphaeroforma arctica JP610]
MPDKRAHRDDVELDAVDATHKTIRTGKRGQGSAHESGKTQLTRTESSHAMKEKKHPQTRYTARSTTAEETPASVAHLEHLHEAPIHVLRKKHVSRFAKLGLGYSKSKLGISPVGQQYRMQVSGNTQSVGADPKNPILCAEPATECTVDMSPCMTTNSPYAATPCHHARGSQKGMSLDSQYSADVAGSWHSYTPPSYKIGSTAGLGPIAEVSGGACPSRVRGEHHPEFSAAGPPSIGPHHDRNGQRGPNKQIKGLIAHYTTVVPGPVADFLLRCSSDIQWTADVEERLVAALDTPSTLSSTQTQLIIAGAIASEFARQHMTVYPRLKVLPPQQLSIFQVLVDPLTPQPISAWECAMTIEGDPNSLSEDQQIRNDFIEWCRILVQLVSFCKSMIDCFFWFSPRIKKFRKS